MPALLALDRRHRGLGPHLRPGQGRGRALSALRVPRRSVRDRVARARRAGRRAACARSGGRGWVAGVGARPPARARLRAPDGRARADDRLERRLHHRPLRRLHAAARAAALPDARGQGGLARGRARRRRARDALRRRRGRPASATCSCSPARRRTRSDRADGAVRAALRRGRVHAGGDARGVRRLRGRRASRSARSSCRAAGRSGARCSSPGIFASALALPRPDLGAAADERDPDCARVRHGAGLGRASSASGSRATGSARSAGAAAP